MWVPIGAHTADFRKIRDGAVCTNPACRPAEPAVKSLCCVPTSEVVGVPLLADENNCQDAKADTEVLIAPHAKILSLRSAALGCRNQHPHSYRSGHHKKMCITNLMDPGVCLVTSTVLGQNLQQRSSAALEVVAWSHSSGATIANAAIAKVMFTLSLRACVLTEIQIATWFQC